MTRNDLPGIGGALYQRCAPPRSAGRTALERFPRANSQSPFAQQLSSAVASTVSSNSCRSQTGSNSGVLRASVRRQDLVTDGPGRQGSVTTPSTPPTSSGASAPSTPDAQTGIRQISTGLFAAFEYPSGMTEIPRAPVPAAPPATTASPAAPPDPVKQFTDALRAAGIDPAPLGLTLSEQPMYYPGGSYLDREITAALPNGTQQRFSANLVQLNPSVAAVELRQLLGTHLT